MPDTPNPNAGALPTRREHPHRSTSRRRRRRPRDPGSQDASQAKSGRVRHAIPLGQHLSLSAIGVPFLALIAAAGFCYFARPILVPLVTAFTLAYLLSPGVDVLSKKLPRLLSVLLVVGLTAALLGALGFLLIEEGRALVSDLPAFVQTLKSQVGDPQGWPSRLPEPVASLVRNSLPELQDQLGTIDFKAIAGSVFAGLGSLIGFLGWSVMVALLTLFILVDMPHLRRQVVRAMGPGHEIAMQAALSDIDRQLRTFLTIKIGISVALGAVATVGLLLLDVPYAWVWGPIAGLLNIVPYVGALISSVPPIVLVAIDRQSALPALWVAAFLILLQQVEGNIVTPKLMGDKIQLNLVSVLVSSIVWGWLWGALGVLLAIPMTAALKVVCERIEPLRPIAVLLG